MSKRHTFFVDRYSIFLEHFCPPPGSSLTKKRPGCPENPGAWPSAGSWRSGPRGPRRSSRIGALLFDERLNPLGEQGDIERLLERFAEAEVNQRLGGRFVFAGEGDDQGLFVLGIAAQVGGNLQGLAAAHGKVDDDRIGMKALGLDAGFKAA